MHGHEGIGQRVDNYLLAVIGHLNGSTLAEGGWVCEVRRSTVQINGCSASTINDSEWPVVDNLDCCGVSYKGEESCGLVFCGCAAKDVIQAGDVREITELLTG